MKKLSLIFFLAYLTNIGDVAAQILDKKVLRQISMVMLEENKMWAYKPQLSNFTLMYDSETYLPFLLKPDTLSNSERKLLFELGEQKIIEILKLNYDVPPIYPLSRKTYIGCKFCRKDKFIIKGRNNFFFKKNYSANAHLYIDTVGIINNQLIVSIKYGNLRYSRNYFFNTENDSPILVSVKTQWNFIHKG